MAKRRKKNWYVTRPARRAWVALAVVVALYAGWRVFDAVLGDTLAARSVLSRLASDEPGEADEARTEMRRMGAPFRGHFEDALLSGGRSFDAQQILTDVLLLEPFYSRDAVAEAMKSKDPVVRRAAASAVLMRYGEIANPPEKIDDDVLVVLAEWTKEPDDRWLPPALGLLGLFRDPRVVDVLIPLAELAPTAANEETRFRAVRRLGPFAGEARAVEALTKVTNRDGEPSRIRSEAIRALAAGGSADPSIYWKAIESEVGFERQAVAENLARVRDPAVIPILVRLLGDPNVDVRRSALNSLVRKRSPIVMDRLDELVEDRFWGIRADLAMAVGQYRQRDRIPFLVWLLMDFDPEVVRIAYVELFKQTKVHHGFTDELWSVWGRIPITDRAKEIRKFMRDEERREAAITEWSKAWGPRKTDRARVPHLVAMLTHRDSGNVERAMKALVKITERSDGFPPLLLEGGGDVAKVAEERVRFMASDREALASGWRAWWATQEK
ncbi:MAG: HEAT repeat domain-containing protein [Planctomycetota bacterium]